MDGDEGGDFSCAGRALAQQRWGKAAANAADKKAAHAKRVETRKKNAARNKIALEELRGGGGGGGGGVCHDKEDDDGEDDTDSSAEESGEDEMDSSSKESRDEEVPGMTKSWEKSKSWERSRRLAGRARGGGSDGGGCAAAPSRRRGLYDDDEAEASDDDKEDDGGEDEYEIDGSAEESLGDEDAARAAHIDLMSATPPLASGGAASLPTL
jgi:hypothetical protein